MTTERWEPIDADSAAAQIGVGVHTGLRKGTDASDSGELWRIINASSTTAWSDAVAYAVDGLESMGLRLCRKVEE